MSVKSAFTLVAASLAALVLTSVAVALQLNNTAGCSLELVQNDGMEPQPGAHSNEMVSRIVALIDSARSTLVVAAHEIDHPVIIDALKKAAARGVSVRVYTDAKDVLQKVELDPDNGQLGRSVGQRINLERLMRGTDGINGTSDDILIQAESPIEAVVRETGARIRAGLPIAPEGLARTSYKVAAFTLVETPIIAPGIVRRATPTGQLPTFRAPATTRMHHKFIIADDENGVTGSFNFTVSGAEGSQFDALAGAELGHRQQMIFFDNPLMAKGYVRYFDALWGGSSGPPSIDAGLTEPAPGSLDFEVTNCGFPVRVMFFPNRKAAASLIEEIKKSSSSVQFEFFAFEDEKFIRAIYEQAVDKKIEVRGIIDERFYSAFADVVRSKLGPEADEFFLSALNGEPRVEKSRLFRLLHSKTMIIDGAGGANPMVITGSANFSINAFEHNRENIVLLKSLPISSQFVRQLRLFANASRVNRAGYCSALQRPEDPDPPSEPTSLIEDD
ncbi:phospholipase D-like domain-containing protein [Rhizobium sp. No.120]